MAIIVVDTDLKCLYAEGVFLRRLGWNPLTMLDKRLDSILDDAQFSIVAPHFRRSLAGLESSQERQTPDYSYQARYVPVRNDANREIVAAMAIVEDVSDITDRKTAERQAAELTSARERTALIGRFVEEVAPYVRTPLAAINSSAYLLSKAATPEKSADHLQEVYSKVSQLEKVVSSTLKFVALQGGETLHFRPVEVNELVNDVLDRLPVPMTGKQIIIEAALAPSLPTIQADVEELSDAVMELLINATRFSPMGTSVQVRTQLEDRQIVIEVEDHGVGIAVDELPRIFEPLFRGSRWRSSTEGNIGLGLPIARQIVQMHGGTIDVKSTLDKGSLFTIYLPIGVSPE
jgi:signal transduction histidine kinase